MTDDGIIVGFDPSAPGADGSAITVARRMPDGSLKMERHEAIESSGIRPADVVRVLDAKWKRMRKSVRLNELAAKGALRAK